LTGNASIDSTRFEIVYQRTSGSTSGTVTPDDASETPSVRLFPNPSKTGDVKLSLRAMVPGAYTLQVLDMLGREVATGAISHQTMNGEYRVLKGKRLSPGKYLIRLSIEGKPVQTLTLIQE
jgi:septal ring-binding cell division protein DamX